MFKLSKVIDCKKTLKLLDKMAGKRRFFECLGNNISKSTMIKNGVPQGSVLAPSLFNIYINDIPETRSMKFGYADDIAIAFE